MEIDGRTFWVRPVSPDVLQSGNVVVAALAESLDKSYPWAVGFLFGNNSAWRFGTSALPSAELRFLTAADIANETAEVVQWIAEPYVASGSASLRRDTNSSKVLAALRSLPNSSSSPASNAWALSQECLVGDLSGGEILWA